MYNLHPSKKIILYILVALSIGFGVFDYLRLENSRLNAINDRVFSLILRETERKSLSSCFWYLVGATLTIALFPYRICAMSILFLAWCDPVAGIIGKCFGRTLFNISLPRGKSVEGMLGAWLVGSIISFFFIRSFLLGGMIAALSEVISFKGIDDNLSMPILSAMMLTFVQ